MFGPYHEPVTRCCVCSGVVLRDTRTGDWQCENCANVPPAAPNYTRTPLRDRAVTHVDRWRFQS